MSLLQNHTLTEATAMFRGERAFSTWQQGFPLDGLEVWRLSGLVAAPGHAELDSDTAWATVIRSWWGLGLTWGLCAAGESGEISWNVVLPDQVPGAREAVVTHLTGARLERAGSFQSLSKRLHSHPFRGIMAGHSGTGPSARLEPAIRSLLGHEFMILVLAKALPQPALQSELHRLSGEEQFVRDEHLSRASLEKDSHAGAARYLELVEASRNRSTSALQEGGWLVRTLVATPNHEVFNQAQSIIHGAFAAEGGQPEPLRWQHTGDPRKLTFLKTAEAAALTRPPRREMPGFSIETRIRETEAPSGGTTRALFATAAPPVGDRPAVSPGRIVDDHGRPGAWLDIGTDDFCRHLLIVGMTGSGKSVTCEHILLELWREHRIPWLVIEPGMKTGYRRLLNSEIGGDLDAWAVGDPRSRRLHLNPMAVPVGVSLAEHTSALFAVISSAFELVAPMPEVLATAIEQTYRNHGWNLAGLVPDGPPPRLADLVEEIDRSSGKLGYGAEVTGNIRAGLLLRMRRLLDGPLAPELASPYGLDTASLVQRPTIIELSALPDAASQALVMGFLTLQLRHHWRLAGQSDSLRHVTLIEEAHRLLKAVPETAANASRTRAVEDLSHMLAELRGFGVGLIIVDQTPAALVSSVIANTGTKILHRLDHPADQELAGRAAGLPDNHVNLLGSLAVGDTILRSDRRPRPYRLRVPNPAVTYGNLPLPALPLPSREAENPINPLPCPVCRNTNCHAYWIGARKQEMKARVARLLALSHAPDQEIRDWVASQLPSNGSTPTPHGARCFLIALGQGTGLKKETLRRFLATLNP